MSHGSFAWETRRLMVRWGNRRPAASLSAKEYFCD